ncbi:MAG TPA: DUF6794 domain-containing protein, partial [Vicinamibacterales bacterium]|nr:DUF6794 domain-containing protein [Vicinamibacterales bacterium]
VSEWSAGDRWVARLSGMHRVEGVSSVAYGKVAAAGGESIFVSWDEQGKDEASTRVLEAYPCAANETPALPPKAIVWRDTWPTTVDEAARRLVAELDEESKARVRGMKKDALAQFYFGWGTGIRNAFGLWGGNEKLLASCGGGTPAHAEACSMVIIEAVWSLLQSQ